MDKWLDKTVSPQVMRNGRHRAQFTLLDTVAGGAVYFGVIRPGWDVQQGSNAHKVAGHCFYHTAGGNLHPRMADLPPESPIQANRWVGQDGCEKVHTKTVLADHFLCRNDHVTKTGSGQT
jgi:hypothetical protein